MKDKRRKGSERLGREFYERGAEEVARELVGAVLVRRIKGKKLKARVVETEAYVGAHDLACHAAKGRTKRTEVMFGEGGHVYVYLIYGMYEMLNVVTGREGDAQAVLIRAAETVGWEGDLSGPGKLAREMKITRGLNGSDLVLGEEIYFERGSGKVDLGESARIGVDYAGEWKGAMLRFFDVGSGAVSGMRRQR